MAKRRPKRKGPEPPQPPQPPIPTPPVGNTAGTVDVLMLLTWPTGETFTVAGPASQFEVSGDAWAIEGISKNAPARWRFELKYCEYLAGIREAD